MSQICVSPILSVSSDPSALIGSIESGTLLACCPCQAVRDYRLSQSAADAVLTDYATRGPDKDAHLVPVALSALLKYLAGDRIDPHSLGSPCEPPTVYVRRYLLGSLDQVVSLDAVRELLEAVATFSHFYPEFIASPNLNSTPSGRNLKSKIRHAVRVAEWAGLLTATFRTPRPDVALAPLSKLMLLTHVVGFGKRHLQLIPYLRSPANHVIELVAGAGDRPWDQKKIFRKEVRTLLRPYLARYEQLSDDAVPWKSFCFAPNSAAYVASHAIHSAHDSDVDLQDVASYLGGEICKATQVLSPVSSREALSLLSDAQLRIETSGVPKTVDPSLNVDQCGDLESFESGRFCIRNEKQEAIVEVGAYREDSGESLSPFWVAEWALNDSDSLQALAALFLSVHDTIAESSVPGGIDDSYHISADIHGELVEHHHISTAEVIRNLCMGDMPTSIRIDGHLAGISACADEQAPMGAQIFFRSHFKPTDIFRSVFRTSSGIHDEGNRARLLAEIEQTISDELERLEFPSVASAKLVEEVALEHRRRA